ncbi:glycoside hydrolase family 113 [Lacinutrix chionoecetis]
MRKLFLSLYSIILLQACASQSVSYNKINGVSFVAAGIPVTDEHINPVVKLQANYAAIMPFGFTKSLEHPEIIHDTERQWYGETKAGAKQYAQSLQAKGIKIMIKPQIWVRNGEFTGYIKMNNEADWKQLENTYSKFILKFADLAEEINAEILCIGTELEGFIINRPEYWNTLIIKIKKKYKGKLTYAANWDEFKRTPFWSQLDYIGVDAYFPISESKTPTIEECIAGWKTHKVVIKEISDKYKKPILFTEYGYRSVDYTGKEPWKSDRSMTIVNLEAQNNATQALFNTFWKEDWFAGGFIWKWFHAHDEVGGENDTQFTPQNKPVEDIIRTHFSEQN